MARTALAREQLFALRETIARLEGKPLPALAAAESQALAEDEKSGKADLTPRLPFGIGLLDEALEGGLPLDGITEIRSCLLRDAGASSGLVLALASRLQHREAVSGHLLPVLWIADRISMIEAGMPYAIGLRDFGLRQDHFLHAAPRRLEEALWLAEVAIESGAFCATILEVCGNPAHFGLAESRRLSLRAKAAGRPLFLLRQAGEEEASSAAFRLFVRPAPAGLRPLPDGSRLGGSIAGPAFRLTLEKSRNPAPLSLILEWNSHDRQFVLVDRAEHAFPSDEQPAHPGAQLSAPAHRSGRPQTMGALLAFERAS